MPYLIPMLFYGFYFSSVLILVLGARLNSIYVQLSSSLRPCICVCCLFAYICGCPFIECDFLLMSASSSSMVVSITKIASQPNTILNIIHQYYIIKTKNNNKIDQIATIQIQLRCSIKKRKNFNSMRKTLSRKFEKWNRRMKMNLCCSFLFFLSLFNFQLM